MYIYLFTRSTKTGDYKKKFDAKILQVRQIWLNKIHSVEIQWNVT